MTLLQHKEIILKWILSCDTNEQLGLLLDVIANFVTKRFEGIADPLELELTRIDLTQALNDQQMMIIKGEMNPEELAPTLAVYNHQ